MSANLRTRAIRLSISIGTLLIASASALATLTVTCPTCGPLVPAKNVIATPPGFFEYDWSSVMSKILYAPAITNVNHTMALCTATGTDIVIAKAFSSSHVQQGSGMSIPYMSGG